MVTIQSPQLRQELQIARRALADGAPIPAGLLHAKVKSSWERTRASGMRPSDRALFHHTVSREEMRRVSDRHRSLIELALADMEHLLRSMHTRDWMLLLTNAEGIIVHAVGNQDCAPRELCLPLHCGRRLLENEIGTNAPVVAIMEQTPVEVVGGEHFLDEMHRFSCAAAPIFNPDGSLAGALDLTGIDVAMDARILQRVCTAVRSIEARMFEGTGDGFLLRVHEDPRYLDTPEQGLLRVRDDGYVTAANRVAQEMLGIAPTPTSLHLSRLFDERSLQRFQDIGAGAVRTVHALSGAHFNISMGGRARSKLRRTGAKPVASFRPDPQWQLALERAHPVFRRGLPILLQGETGTGKEWFARHLHDSNRPGKPFVAVNCAAIAEGIAEAELFGHVEGAYTGSRKGGASGQLEQADGGTLFLDEIGDMPAHLQTRLLRVLQERSITRIGSHREVKLDILVISATHRDLAHLVAAGSFREDLYFRLNGLKLRLPALRERQDMDQLIDVCLRDAALDGQAPSHLPDLLRRRLLDYAWPGNIRQLRHVLEVASALADPHGEIGADMFPEELFAASSPCAVEQACPDPVQATPAAAPQPVLPAEADSSRSLSSMRHEMVVQALREYGGNVSATAKSLGISRTTLYRYLRCWPGHRVSSE